MTVIDLESFKRQQEKTAGDDLVADHARRCMRLFDRMDRTMRIAWRVLDDVSDVTAAAMHSLKKVCLREMPGPRDEDRVEFFVRGVLTGLARACNLTDVEVVRIAEKAIRDRAERNERREGRKG